MKYSSCLLACLLLALAPAGGLRAADSTATDLLQQNFVAPPMEARPIVRWWWFGPSVVKPELEKEMNYMKEGGFGGFEVQPTYPLATDGQYPGLRNFKFLSPEFFDMLGFTAAKAKELGLRFDLTLGSGWPFGGPMFNHEEAAQTIAELGPVAVQPGQATVAAPAPAPAQGEPRPVMAALLGPVTDAAPGASPYLPLPVADRTAQLPANLHGATHVTFFTATDPALIQVKRPALGAEGYIVDHYGTAAIQKFIDQIALPEINACGPNVPFSIFCDSLEISGEGWTPNFLAEFKQRRGYDLAPLLPALFDNNFPQGADIRGDYGKTVAEIFDDNFVKTFAKLAQDHHTRFRIQAYSTPPTTLMTYADANLDEGEQYNWRQFSGTRWASSASHLLDRPLASAEAFTWLHSPVFMAAPIDIKAESNLQFLNGVNQLLCHGWPYTAPGVEYPGWRFYAAAVFNEKNPWWIAMHDINDYLARASYLLRQGAPANDVALYLPEEDAYTAMTPTSLQLAAAGGGILGPHVSNLMPAILDSGYNLDFIDDGVLALRGQVDGATLAFGASKYKIIILPDVTRIPLATLEKFADFANHGGILIATGALPSQSPGHRATASDNQTIQHLSQQLFSGPDAKGIVTTPERLGATLISKLPPDVAYSRTHSELGFIHRHLDGGELYFLVNTSNQPVSDTAIVRTDGLHPEWWDATTGRIGAATNTKSYAGATGISVNLPPYGTQFLVFTNRQLPSPGLASEGRPAPIDLSTDWKATFQNSAPEASPAPRQVATLGDWTTDPALKYFSGTATYEKEVVVSAAQLAAQGFEWYLDFGPGAPANVPGGNTGNPSRANFQPPVGDAAVVWVNGQRAGAVWCPPYRVEVTSLLKPGANQIRIQVGNRAINYMADQQHHPLPDYTALNATYPPKRFDAQDLNVLQIQPSGLLGIVQLTARVENE